MPSLRSTLQSNPETVQDLELALEDRFLEGLQCMYSGYPHAAAYLLGYAVEMALKTGYFLLIGSRPADLVGALLGPARSAGKRLIPNVPLEGYHSLSFWAYLIIAQRIVQAKAFPTGFRRRLL